MNFRAHLRCLLFVITSYSLSASADGWTEYSTPQFQLYTNASAAVAEDWVTTLDTFTKLLPAPRPSDKPRYFKIIVLSDYGLFQNITPLPSSTGFIHFRDDTEYLIVGRGIRPYPPAQHKKLILALFQSTYVSWHLRGYPYWFSHGAGQLFKSAEITGNQVIMRNDTREVFAYFPALEPMALADLMFASPAFGKQAYNLSSYAYMHYLLFGSVNGYPDYRDKLSLYLASGAQTQQAFEQIMGQPLTVLERDYKQYIQASDLKTVSIKLADDAQPISQHRLSDDESNYLMARLLHQRNEYDYAQKYVKKISKASPQYAELQQQYQTHEAQEKALKTAEKTLKKEPDNVELLTMAANAYMEQADITSTKTGRNALFHKAISHAQRASELKPDDKDLHILLRRAYVRTGQFDKAFHHTKEQLRLEPENAETNFSVGSYYLSRSEYENARIYFNKACQLDNKQCEFTEMKFREIEQREAGTLTKP